MHNMGCLGHTLQIDLPRDWANPAASPVPGRVEGGGQPVLRCEQCFILFQVFLSFLRLLPGANILSFACSSPVGGMLFGVSGLLLLLQMYN